MVLYYEHSIKHKLDDAYNVEEHHRLHQVGVGDLMSHLIQFMQSFAIDANKGKNSDSGTTAAVALAANSDLGGWHVQDDHGGVASRR